MGCAYCGLQKVVRLSFLWVVALFLTISSISHAQDVDFEIAGSIGGTGSDIGESVVVDSSGNVYIVGDYEATADFNPDVGVANLTSAGLNDIFVVKFNSSNAFVWAKSFGGTGNEFGLGIDVDASGNVYVAGQYEGTADFDPDGVDTANLTSAGLFDVVVIKLDSSGDYLWAKSIGGTSDDGAEGVAVDAAGNAYVIGDFVGTADFDPSAGISNITSNGSSDIFVQKLDTSGAFIWAKAFGSTANDRGFDISLDGAGNVYTTGTFTLTVDFDPNAGTADITSAGNGDAFISCLDSSGNYVWAKGLGGIGDERGYGIQVDALGNIYTTGRFTDTADFDPGVGTANLVSNGSRDVYVSKLDSSGGYVWAKGFGGIGTDRPWNIAVDSSNNVYSIGGFTDTVDFDTGAGTLDVVSAGGRDFFLHRINADGTFGWVKTVGDLDSDEGFGVAVDAQGRIYSAGRFYGSADFDPSVGIFNLFSAGVGDMFIQKLTPSAPTVKTIVPATVGPIDTTSLDFTVTFSDGVANFNDAADVIVNHTGTGNAGVSISGGPSIYTVSVTGITGAGSFTLEVDTTSDIEGLTGLALASTVTSAAVTITPVPPTADSIIPDTTGPTNSPSIDFTITFNEDVVNFNDAADLVIDHTFTSHTGVNITGGPQVYTATVSGISGFGSFNVTVDTTSDVQDVGAVGLASSVTSAEVLMDTTLPTIDIGAPSLAATNGTPVSYAVTYSGANTVNLTAGDITLDTTGGATGQVLVTDGATNTPTVTINTLSGEGTIGFTIEAGTASDNAGNIAAASSASTTFIMDNVQPTVSISAPSVFNTQRGPVVFQVYIEGATVIDLPLEDILLNGTATGTISVINGTTANPTITISNITGTGILGITLNEAIAEDALGNFNDSLTVSTTFGVVTDSVLLAESLSNGFSLLDTNDDGILTYAESGLLSGVYSGFNVGANPSGLTLDELLVGRSLTPSSLSLVWINFNTTFTEFGTFGNPFDTLLEAEAMLNTNAVSTINFTSGGTSTETLTLGHGITSTLTLDASYGAVQIGVAP